MGQLLIGFGENMIYTYTFQDGTVLKLIDTGLSLAEIWKLEEIHGKCLIGAG